MSTASCPLCNGTRKVQRRGYQQRCEPCDEREIRELRIERDKMRPVLTAARLVIGGGDFTKLVDAVVDYDVAGERK